MRFNPDTQRAQPISVIAAQCANAVIRANLPAPQAPNRVWDCKNGGWLLPTA